MIKIRYSKEILRSNLRTGKFFLLFGVVLVLISFLIGKWRIVSIESIGIGQIAAGFFMLILYFFKNKNQYLTLKNGELLKNGLLPKKIKLNEISEIKEFAGDIKVYAEKKQLIIDTQIIDPNSLELLRRELKNYAPA